MSFLAESKNAPFVYSVCGMSLSPWWRQRNRFHIYTTYKSWKYFITFHANATTLCFTSLDLFISFFSKRREGKEKLWKTLLMEFFFFKENYSFPKALCKFLFCKKKKNVFSLHKQMFSRVFLFFYYLSDPFIEKFVVHGHFFILPLLGLKRKKSIVFREDFDAFDSFKMSVAMMFEK